MSQPNTEFPNKSSAAVPGSSPAASSAAAAEPTAESGTAPDPKSREISGRAVVIAMLTAGVFATSMLFLYFELHTAPFRPLREAIGREFRHSRPNVEGGRVKGTGPKILRISMSVPFDPFLEETKSAEINKRVLEIARQHQDLAGYDHIQINLILFTPETTAKRRTFDWTGPAAAKVEE